MLRDKLSAQLSSAQLTMRDKCETSRIQGEGESFHIFGALHGARRQRAEGRGQKAEGRRQKAAVSTCTARSMAGRRRGCTELAASMTLVASLPAVFSHRLSCREPDYLIDWYLMTLAAAGYTSRGDVEVQWASKPRSKHEAQERGSLPNAWISDFAGARPTSVKHE